jgi:protein TonB
MSASAAGGGIGPRTCQNADMATPDPILDSTPAPKPGQHPPLLPPQVFKVLLAAFAAGLLLFLLVWLKSRHHYDFYKADGSEATTTPADHLPTPLPPDFAGDNNASGLSLPKDSTVAARPAAPPPPPPPPARAPLPPTAAPVAAPAASTDAIAQNTPAPRYPQEPLRRGIGGTVKVRVSVAVDGSVERQELAEGSGNRDLDRAALDAVRRWHFKPATRNGKAVSSEVIVPIVFNPH